VADGDAEGVHQMRVGLRRFRAALSLFKELVEQPDVEHIKSELKWLTEQLGAARDLDVLLKEGVERLQRQEPEAGEVHSRMTWSIAAESRSRAPRRRSRVNATGNLCSSARSGLPGVIGRCRATRSLWRVVTFASPISRLPSLRAGRARSSKSKKLEALDTRRRHKLRIAIKKVRYACEFFESVYEGRKVERRRKVFTATLKGIQSGLGRLNDMQVHCRLAHRFAHSKSGVPNQAEKAFAIGLLTGREHAEAAAILADAVKAARNLSDTKPFWH
jgi:CHAD domain-containing protein